MAAPIMPTRQSTSTGWPSRTIPTSDYLNAGLAELYARTGRIRDAVLEAQDILKRDGNNLEARRLLGRIYLRSLGDMQAGTQSQEVLKLAIEQYEQIVKLDPKSVEDHLLLGRLYRLNNELLKVGERVQDRGQHPARFGRGGHHAGHPLQRRGRHLARLAGVECFPRERPLRQAVLRAGLHLRAEEGLQEGDRRLSKLGRS